MAELEIRPTAAMRMRAYGVVAVAVLATLALCWLLAGGGANVFTPRATVYTYLPDATGLDQSSSVRLSGLEIGDITKVEISGIPDPQRAVRVSMRILRSYLNRIPADSQTSIDEDTLVGFQFISVDEGKSSVPIADGGTLPSAPLKQATDKADLIAALEQNLTQVDEALVVMSSGQTKLGQLILGSKEYTDFVAKVTAFSRSMAAAVAPETGIGRMIYSSADYDRIHNAAVNADRMLADIQAGRGAVGRMVSSDEQYQDFVRRLSRIRASLADLNAGRGAAGRLLQDDEDYRKIQRLLASTDDLIGVLTSRGSRTGDLLNSPELYESLNGAVSSLEKLLTDIDQNPRKYLRLKVF